MEVTLKTVAQFINAQIFGNDKATVNNIAPIEKAKKGDLTFIANKKYLKYINKTEATAVILSKYNKEAKVNQLVVKDPYLAYAKILDYFTKRNENFFGIDKNAFIADKVTFADSKKISIYPFVFIDESVYIGKNVTIFPNVFIGKNCKIDDNTIIYSNVSIYPGSIIGKNVIIHSGTVIGSDGYGYARDGEAHFKIPQIGNIIIEDNVEIGANCAIDRGALNSTIIKKGTKIDNLVHIAHNVEIGENSLIVAQVGISGSCKIGKNVILAGQVGVAGHLNIGDNCMVGAQSGIGKDLAAQSIVSGSPAVEHSKWLRWAVKYQELPNIIKKMKQLEKEIEKLKRGEKNA